jgi:hypothetical protein
MFMKQEAIDQRVFVRADFENSPINTWPDGLNEVDTVRLGDSKLNDLLNACAILANEFARQFLPDIEVSVDHINFFSSSSKDSIYFSAVMADRTLPEDSFVLITTALHIFCSQSIEGALDIFNRNAGDTYGLTAEQKCFVEEFAADFIIKKNGVKIKDPFILRFPSMPVSSDIAAQGKFLPPATLAKKVDSYEGVARSDGGQITRKLVYLEFCDGHDQVKRKAMPFSVDDEALARLVCEAAGNPSRRLRVEADQLENGVGQRQWALRIAEAIPDDSVANFTLR